MKDTFYFSHDYNARNDSKIKKLLSKHGFLGYGLFWAIIEDLYNNANALPTDYDSIAFDLRTDKKIIQDIITGFDLFVIDGDIFGSHSIEKRLEHRNEKSLKARQSALKRWNKDANALRTQSDSNAIKESIVKESIVNDKIEKRKDDFKIKLKAKFPKENLNRLKDFFEYWTEHSEGASKMRFEKEAAFDLGRRLATWKKNEKPGTYESANAAIPTIS
jgi:hypothetical protein